MAPLSTDSAAPVATRSTYVGLFLVTLATIAYQILLTRIFSVTIWYHFAFLAISIAMLGMTVGAIAIYLLPSTFSDARVHRQLANAALAFALTTILSLLLHLAIPVRTDGSLGSVLSLVATCSMIAVPFTASGICVALVLTKFPRQVGSLYATDLAGAAIGCVSLIALLWATDGPTAVFAIALLANIAALCFATEARSKAFTRFATATAVAIGLFVVGHTVLVHQQKAWVRVNWAITPQGPTKVERPLFEKWNTHSRVRVFGDPVVPSNVFGWSMSPTLPKTEARQLIVDIDSGALTVMTAFDGRRTQPLDYLRYDLTNLAHYLRKDADVLVIGAGGGRDMLSALVFDQASVKGLEINSNILGIVNDEFGDFTGHLDRHPKVTFVNDEARSYVARSEDAFDIIQISLIDSWAATAAGAFVLTEHALYTVEAWKIFLEHLKPGGILTVTRYYFPENPGTAYRLTSLAVAALEESGVEHPEGHIALVRLAPKADSSHPTMVTTLVSRDPLSEDDLKTLSAVTDKLEFLPVLNPNYAVDETFRRISAGGDLSELYAEFPLNITPSTDDRPFFFHMLRFRDMLDPERLKDQGMVNFNIRAVFVLGVLLATVAALTVFFVVVPLLIRGRLTNMGELWPWFLLFAGIGAGFMMIEISQMERLIVFLGHPVYALSVVLFTLLLASGLGSYSVQRVPDDRLAEAVPRRLAVLLGVLLLFGLITPSAVALLQGASTPVRVMTAIGLLAPIGLFMGMPFPMGMRAASGDSRSRELTPWLWGMNGATSVLASVLAIVVAMGFGISTSFWVGFGCYLLATGGLLWALKTRVPG
jgi:spermidine synthase